MTTDPSDYDLEGPRISTDGKEVHPESMTDQIQRTRWIGDAFIG